MAMRMEHRLETAVAAYTKAALTPWFRDLRSAVNRTTSAADHLGDGRCMRFLPITHGPDVMAAQQMACPRCDAFVHALYKQWEPHDAKPSTFRSQLKTACGPLIPKEDASRLLRREHLECDAEPGSVMAVEAAWRTAISSFVGIKSRPWAGGAADAASPDKAGMDTMLYQLKHNSTLYEAIRPHCEAPTFVEIVAAYKDLRAGALKHTNSAIDDSTLQEVIGLFTRIVQALLAAAATAGLGAGVIAELLGAEKFIDDEKKGDAEARRQRRLHERVSSIISK
mmetsp:Transcript_15388/g.53445  ORF Transcript_15388/g.53445 Transcript_15388/m.53445 type:complete len:281 (-) Transcript_15388:23-865(-)